MVGKYPLKGNAKASILKDRSGFVKIIADAKSEEIIGGTAFLGPQATELIHEALMIMQMRATAGMWRKPSMGIPACTKRSIGLLRHASLKGRLQGP